MQADMSLDNDDKWSELEAEIKIGCSKNKLLSICRGRPLPAQYRNFVWQHCLEVNGLQDPFVYFDGVYDLPEQAIIRSDCHNLVDKLANVEEERLSVESDLESTLTLFCKSRNIRYSKDRGWLAILKPLIAAKLIRSDLYNVFSTIVENFVARDHPHPRNQFHFFRLLLLHHDPELCRFLDTKKVSPEMFASSWFTTLFASHCDIQVVLNIWDIYFQFNDPFLVQFLALVIVINARDQVLCMEMGSKEDISEKLRCFPSALEADDIEDFCSLAHYYISKTPKSFMQLYHPCIYGSYSEDLKGYLERETRRLENALCLEVSVEDVLNSMIKPNSSMEMKQAEPMKFFVIDCRPAYQFKVGHLANSYHLNSHLMLQNPKEFNSKVQSLLTPPTAKSRDLDDDVTSSSNNLLVNGGEHLCFVGEGSKHSGGHDDDGGVRDGDDDDGHMMMVVAHFLQKHTQYVSVCRGGYEAIHNALKNSSSSGNLLIGHNVRSCDYCNPKKSLADIGQSQNAVFPVSEAFLVEKFEKLSNAFKSTSNILKDKVITYIKNEQPPTETHVSSSDKVGRRYRNMASVFTIGDDDDDSAHFLSSEEETKEMVNIDIWVKRFINPNSIYECFEILPNSTRPSLLCLNDNHLIILRKVPDEPGKAWLQNRRSLCSILKITSKKRQPQFITIKYGAGGYATNSQKVENTGPVDALETEDSLKSKREESQTNGDAGQSSKPRLEQISKDDDLRKDDVMQEVEDRKIHLDAVGVVPESKEAGNEDGKKKEEISEVCGVTVTAIDRFLIPKAGEATKDIKAHIMRIVDMLES